MTAQGQNEARPPLDPVAGIVGVLTVVLANGLFLSGLAQVIDPTTTSMEPYFIDMARRPLAAIVGENPEWGPLYALWLKPFWLVLGDPLLVYSANVYALALATSLAIYAYLLLATGRASVAAAAALFFVVSDLNVPLSSKVCSFAAMVVLVSLALSQLLSGPVARWLVVSVGALLASYARPELYPAAILLWLAAAWRSFRPSFRLWSTASIGRRGAIPFVGLLIAVPAATVGTPLWSRHGENDRLFAALREHFAWNWAHWNGRSKYVHTVWELEFGDARTVLDALFANPGALLRHVGENLSGVGRFLTASAFEHEPLIAGAFAPSIVRVENLLVGLFCGVVIAAVLAVRRYRAEMGARYGQSLLVFCALAVSPLAASALIYPSPHYLVLPGLIVILAVALACSLLLPAGRPTSARGYLLFALCSLWFVPRPHGAPVILGTRPVTDTVTHIRSLGLRPPVHVLSMTDGIGELLGDGFEEIKVWGRNDQPLEEYIKAEHVDVIVTMERGRYSFVVDDPYWQTIQLTPADAGFRLSSSMPDESARVWVRSPPLP